MQAVDAYRAALEVRTRERVPLDWASTQNSLGTVLWTLGKRETGTERLAQAVDAYRAALEVRTRERMPLDWAITQNNLGTVLFVLDERENGTARLEQAVDAHRAVLEIRTRGDMPVDWAATQHNLGNVLLRAGSAMGRFVGVKAYEAAGGPVLHDLFADEHENGVWLEDPVLLTELAIKKLTAAADELATRWKWAEAMPKVDWSATARYGRIHPEPGEPTDEEKAEIERLRTRHDELANMDDDEWTEELVAEAEGIEARLDAIEAEVDVRATFRPEDFAIVGCIATIGRDGTLQIIQGLVKPEDMPKETSGNTDAQDARSVLYDNTTLVQRRRLAPDGPRLRPLLTA